MEEENITTCRVMIERPNLYQILENSPLSLPREICDMIEQYVMQPQLHDYPEHMFKFIPWDINIPRITTLEGLREAASASWPVAPTISRYLYDRNLEACKLYMTVICAAWMPFYCWGGGVNYICGNCHKSNRWKSIKRRTFTNIVRIADNECHCEFVCAPKHFHPNTTRRIFTNPPVSRPNLSNSPSSADKRPSTRDGGAAGR